MKASSNYELKNLAGEYMLIPKGDEMNLSAVMTLNETGLCIWNLLQEDTTLDAVIDGMAREYDVEREVLKQDVIEYIEQLKASKLLEV